MSTTSSSMVHREGIDPVCAMVVDPSDAPGISKQGGRSYYFCSVTCKLMFDSDPSHFITVVGWRAWVRPILVLADVLGLRRLYVV